jgi:hypothetical protein
MSTKIFNVEAYSMDIEFTQNDTIDLAFSVTKNKVAYDMTGMTVTMTVRNCNVGKTIIKTLVSPNNITISTSSIHIVSTGFAVKGKYEYDIQVTNGSNILTIAYGSLSVVEEETV